MFAEDSAKSNGSDSETAKKRILRQKRIVVDQRGREPTLYLPKEVMNQERRISIGNIKEILLLDETGHSDSGIQKSPNEKAHSENTRN